MNFDFYLFKIKKFDFKIPRKKTGLSKHKSSRNKRINQVIMKNFNKTLIISRKKKLNFGTERHNFKLYEKKGIFEKIRLKIYFIFSKAPIILMFLFKKKTRIREVLCLIPSIFSVFCRNAYLNKKYLLHMLFGIHCRKKKIYVNKTLVEILDFSEKIIKNSKYHSLKKFDFLEFNEDYSHCILNKKADIGINTEGVIGVLRKQEIKLNFKDELESINNGRRKCLKKQDLYLGFPKKNMKFSPNLLSNISEKFLVDFNKNIFILTRISRNYEIVIRIKNDEHCERSGFFYFILKKDSNNFLRYLMEFHLFVKNSVNFGKFIINKSVGYAYLNLFYDMNLKLLLMNLKIKSLEIQDICCQINSIRFTLCRFSSVFSPRIFDIFSPPISDELIPICHLLVNHTCDFLIRTSPLYWTKEILFCISSLLRCGDYFGVLRILNSMASFFDSRGNCSFKTTGISPKFWEAILDLFLFLDETTTPFFVKFLEKVPLNNAFFISESSSKYFINTRILLTLMLQKHLSRELINIEKYINKLLLFNKSFQLKKKYFNNYEQEIKNKDVREIKSFKYDIEFKTNISEIYNFVPNENEKYLIFQEKQKRKESKFQKKLVERKALKYDPQNYKCSPFNLHKFKVIKYFDSRIILYSKNLPGQSLQISDIVIVLPYQKDDNKVNLMSFRQLARVIDICHSRDTSNKKFVTLNLYIRDPGIDPSGYKYCFIVSVLNLYFHQKKIEFLKSLTMINTGFSYTSSEKQPNHVINKLLFETLKDNLVQKDYQNRCSSFNLSEKKKEIIYGNVLKKNMIIKTNPYDCSLVKYSKSKNTEDLFSYLLSKTNVYPHHLEILIKLSDVQKEAVLMSLKKDLFLINGTKNSGKTFIISMIIYCKKIIDPNSKILVVAKNSKSANLINFNLESKSISTFNVEEEYFKKNFIFPKNDASRYKIFERDTNLFLKYQVWLKNILKQKNYDVFIINSIDINIDVLYSAHFDELKEKSYFNHLIVDDTDALNEIELLMILSLNYENITLVGNTCKDIEINIKSDKKSSQSQICRCDNTFERIFNISECYKCRFNDSYSEFSLLKNSGLVSLDKKCAFNLSKNLFGRIKKNLAWVCNSQKCYFIDSFHYFIKKGFCRNICDFFEANIIVNIIKWISKVYLEDLEINEFFCLSKGNWFDILYNPNIYVIAHYESQKKLILNLLNMEINKNPILRRLNIHVQSLERSIYLESDIVLLLASESDSSFELASINIEDKINSIFINYDQKLIIIGNSSMLNKEEDIWSFWINWMIHNGLFIDYLQLKNSFEK